MHVKTLLILIQILLVVIQGFTIGTPEKEMPGIEPFYDAGQEAVRTGSIEIDGKLVKYRSTAAMMPLRDEKGKVIAHIFYIAYTREGVSDLKTRPILFSFNGGPGSCSVWMHMGFLGPRRVVYDDEGFMPKPPFRLSDNPHSILDEADLVFIDPVGTGYSRMMPGQDPHRYHGLMEDIESIAEFIRLFTSRHQRWLSPKFIIGESYGTTRAAGLTGYLQNEHRMYINGTILVSSMNLGVQPGVDLSQALILPHYAATAWYHNCLDDALQSLTLPMLLKEIEAFCLDQYAPALIKGSSIRPEDKAAMAQRLEHYTGIPAEIHIKHHLRIDRYSFRRELLAKNNQIIGRLDSRYRAPVNDRSGLSQFDSDPAMNHWNGPFTATVNHLIRTELGYQSDLDYFIFGDVHPWKGMHESRVGNMLHQAMIQNPHLNVLVMAGYFDGATDHFSIQYAMNHIDLAGVNRDRLHYAFYECGHMMYLRMPDLIKAKSDLARFIRHSR